MQRARCAAGTGRQACDPSADNGSSTPTCRRAGAPAIEVSPPQDKDSVRFAVIGDSGTGDQVAVRSRRADGEVAREVFPFEFVIMLGDNIYGCERPQDFKKKFEKPYKAAARRGRSSSTRRSATTTIRTSASTSRST